MAWKSSVRVRNTPTLITWSKLFASRSKYSGDIQEHCSVSAPTPPVTSFPAAAS
jgi:hypothetical protein